MIQGLGSCSTAPGQGERGATHIFRLPDWIRQHDEAVEEAVHVFRPCLFLHGAVHTPLTVPTRPACESERAAVRALSPKVIAFGFGEANAGALATLKAAGILICLAVTATSPLEGSSATGLPADCG